MAAKIEFSDLIRWGKHPELPLYTRHALERMAPASPSAIAELIKQVWNRELLQNKVSFANIVDPRGISFDEVDEVMASGSCRNKADTVVYSNRSLTVVLGRENSRVITVFPRKGAKKSLSPEFKEKIRREAQWMGKRLSSRLEIKKMVNRIRAQDNRSRNKFRRRARDAKYNIY